MENIRVVVRIRPFLPDEEPHSCVTVSNHQISIGEDRHFAFDYVFDVGTTSETLNDEVLAPLVEAFVNGYTVSTIAYGQTGAGKTFTMSSLSSDVVRRMPAALKTFSFSDEGEWPEIRFSAVEVYNEQVSDLIGPTTSPAIPLLLREDAQNGVYIKGLSEVAVSSEEELLKWIENSLANRYTASTSMNAASSRSHCLLTVTLKYKGVVSRLGLVDLAGSERRKKAYDGRFVTRGACGTEDEKHAITNSGRVKAATVASRMRESISINSGLLALGNVITALCKQKSYIPYRSSKLTRLLQPMLAGNSKTTIIACVSPAESSFEETLNTLKYADRAKSICTVPFKQVFEFVPSEAAEATILRLRQQLAIAQQQLKEQRVFTGLPLPVVDQEQTKELEELIACERKLSQRLKEDLFNAEYTAMIEVEKRKVLERRVKELEALQFSGPEKSESNVFSVLSGNVVPENNSVLLESEAEHNSMHATERQKENDEMHLARYDNDTLHLGDTAEDFTTAEHASCEKEKNEQMINHLVRQREDAVQALKYTKQQQEEMQSSMLLLQEKLSQAEAKLESTEVELQENEEGRRKAEAHYQLLLRRAEDAVARCRRKPKDTAAPVSTRDTDGQAVNRQLQAQVLEMSEELNRQRHVALEVQKRVHKVTALHLRESKLLRQQIHEANAQIARLQVQLQKKERDVARAKKNISSARAASCSCFCHKQQQEEKLLHSSLSNAVQFAALSDDVQNEINAELQVLTNLEIEIGILKEDRDELLSILNEAQGGPDTEIKWTRAKEGFTMRLEHLEEALESHELTEELRLQHINEKNSIEKKLSQLQAVEPILANAAKQLSELNDTIDSLQEERKYRLRRVRRLQKEDSTIQVESVVASGLLSLAGLPVNLRGGGAKSR